METADVRSLGDRHGDSKAAFEFRAQRWERERRVRCRTGQNRSQTTKISKSLRGSEILIADRRRS
jgi:hypothetical protein